MKLFCSCPKGLESLLSEELSALGINEIKPTSYGVYCDVSETQLYEVCLWSRLANRVLLPLITFDCVNADTLYEGVQQIEWLQHIDVTSSIAVDFKGNNDAIKNTAFGAQKVKDAIVDQVRSESGERPSIDTERPDVRVNVHLRKDKVTVSIDLSGKSLHMRGYRTEAGVAPLKENLAVAILKRAGIDEFVNHDWSGGAAIIDPMCGSGTLLIEAAMILTDRAPGLGRDYFGFFGWKQFNGEIWGCLKDDAFDRFDSGKASLKTKFLGYDWSAVTLDTAKRNAERVELDNYISFLKQPLKALQKPRNVEFGLVVSNPPYGARIGEVEELKSVYADLGSAAQGFLKEEAQGEEATGVDTQKRPPGWRLTVFTGNSSLFAASHWRYSKKYKLLNGTIPCELFIVPIEADALKAPELLLKNRGRNWQIKHEERAAMFANRLKKNQKNLSKWLKKEGINCYRLYDADMPEYSMAIDIYDKWVHVQEYQAPKTISLAASHERFFEALAVIRNELSVPAGNIIYKQRKRQSGDSQYEKMAEISQKFTVSEYGVKLQVNLTDYLDTGLFLDHRPIRKWIQQNSTDKRFLNLFCYTGVATLHAIKGGAKSTVSVDMSKTYTAWLEENLALNAFTAPEHVVTRDNVLNWVKHAREGFDLIFLDPPTFSNSKKMEGVFDVQRDHVLLVDECMRLLAPKGKLIFSNNLRKFVLDEGIISRYQVSDIQHQSIDPDFKRNSGIHHCWLIENH